MDVTCKGCKGRGFYQLETLEGEIIVCSCFLGRAILKSVADELDKAPPLNRADTMLSFIFGVVTGALLLYIFV